MLTGKQVHEAQARTVRMMKKAGIAVTPAEASRIEVADFGLGELARTGLEILVYVNNARYCAKELVMFPRQTCPQHKHPAIAGCPGKMETFRCRQGKVYLYTPGRPARKPGARPPRGSERHYTVWHETVLGPGDQSTIPPGTMHWFQAGPKGAIVSEFSSRSRDESDVFKDPRIRRATKVAS